MSSVKEIVLFSRSFRTNATEKSVTLALTLYLTAQFYGKFRNTTQCLQNNSSDFKRFR